MTDYRRGMILAELSRTDAGPDAARAADAIGALEKALSTNPHFSPLHAPIARQTLASLRGPR